MQQQGYNAIGFATADAALEHMGWREDAPQLNRNLPDAIITDNDTESKYTGMDVLRAARQANIPRIMAAGSAHPAGVLANGGPEGVLLRKPYLEDKLVEVLEKALAEKGASPPPPFLMMPHSISFRIYYENMRSEKVAPTFRRVSACQDIRDNGAEWRYTALHES